MEWLWHFRGEEDFRYNQIHGRSVHSIAPLAQLDRASGYEPEGREFESLRAHHSFKHPPRKSHPQFWVQFVQLAIAVPQRACGNPGQLAPL